MGETVPKRVRDIVLAVYRVGDPEHKDRALEERAVTAVREAVPALAQADDDRVGRQLRNLGDEGWLSFHTADGVTRWGPSLKAVGQIGLDTLKQARGQPSAQQVPASPSNDEDEPATLQPTPAPEPPSSGQSEDSETDKGGDKGEDQGNGVAQRSQQVLSAVGATAGADGWAEDTVIFAALTKQSQWANVPWYAFTAELRKLVSGGHLERGKGKTKGHYRLASDGAGEGDGEVDDTEKKGEGKMQGQDDSGGSGAGPGRSGKPGKRHLTYEARLLLGWNNTPGETPAEKMVCEIPLADTRRIFELGTEGSAQQYLIKVTKDGYLKKVRPGVYQWATDVSQLGQDNAASGGEEEPKKQPKPGPKKGGVKKPKAGKKGRVEEPQSPQAVSSSVKEAGADTSFQDTVAAVTGMSPWFPQAMEAANCVAGLSLEDRKAALKAAKAITKLPVEQQRRAFWLVAALCGLEGSGGGFADDDDD